MRLRIPIICCLAFLFLTGWGHWGPNVKIGVSLDHAQDREPFVHKLREAMGDDRAELLLKDSMDDPAAQEEQVKDLLKAGIQALVVVPGDQLKAGSLVKAAHQAGIKVISVERAIPGSDYLIAFNPEKAGELQAQALVRKVPRGRYALFGKNSADWRSQEIRKGQMKILQPLIDRGDIRIAAAQWFPPSETARKMKTILSRETTRINAVLASDSEIAEGAIEYLVNAEGGDKVTVAGLGVDLTACRRIASGTQTLTVYGPPRKLAVETAYLAAKLARQATQFDCQFVEVPNGREKVQAVLLTPAVVDAKNLDSTVINDKVHKKGDVYGK